MRGRKISKWFLLLLVIGVTVACSKEVQTNTSANMETTKDDTELSGSVIIDGSGTVYPLMAKIAEEYMLTLQPGVSVEVSRAGTSAGFKKFLTESGTNFNNASRQMKDEEKEIAEQLNLDIKELKVALDGLTFVIHPENNWAAEMTADEIKSIFLADSNIEKWSDIRPEWPNESINKYGPNENHGTYEFFYENILEEKDLKENVELHQEYASLVNLISDDINGIAFFGYGYFASNTDKMKAVAIDFGDGAVLPSLDTISEDGAYRQFTRPVFTYLNVNHAKDEKQILDYTLFLLKNINGYASETGFAPLPEAEIEKNIHFIQSLQ